MTICYPEDGDGDVRAEGEEEGKEEVKGGERGDGDGKGNGKGEGNGKWKGNGKGEEEGEKKGKKTYGVGERVDVEAGRVHEVWMGGEGCEYVVGEM